jgi:hypothetical protein
MGIVCNAEMRVAEIRKFCKLDEAEDRLIRAAMSQMNLSARTYHRILKLSRTIADLARSENIQPPHLAEALQYRPKFLRGVCAALAQWWPAPGTDHETAPNCTACAGLCHPGKTLGDLSTFASLRELPPQLAA